MYNHFPESFFYSHFSYLTVFMPSTKYFNLEPNYRPLLLPLQNSFHTFPLTKTLNFLTGKGSTFLPLGAARAPFPTLQRVSVTGEPRTAQTAGPSLKGAARRSVPSRPGLLRF